MAIEVYGPTQTELGFLASSILSYPLTHMRVHTAKKEQVGEPTFQLNKKLLTW